MYFNAIWLPLNKKNIFMLQKVEKKYPSMSFFVIDTDYFKGFCRRFDISRIPTFTVMKNGGEIGRIEKKMKTSNFIAFFDDICINDR